ncbi:TadE/TadG family type IV pilus assembly protein [Marimonas arenosa]|uniref:Pilus assembly protein n=1 Tax=Marimonas arenosa TaxID=1795305 RepID=A0AAE3WAM3_9RHOB|nr:TadE/TadG family type IV pilus assembly protein [Marimonas arenosa]MDQ2089686.1 pilus assembly protein [Marimonas arenosa]
MRWYPRHISDAARRFRKDDRGSALVELAISLPLLLLVFAVIIEGSRLFWAYQMTAAGVRDAARYLARIADSDSCVSGASFSTHTDKMTEIVRQTSTGNSLLPSSITVTSVSPQLICISGAFRQSPVPIAQVTATIEVTFPFGGVFGLMQGLDDLATITTTVTDQSRVFGA